MGYLLRRLKALCEDNLRKSLDFDNCVTLLLTAKKHRAEGLKEICMDFLVANEAKMKSLPSFKLLTEEPILLYELLMRRKAAVSHSFSGDGPGAMSPGILNNNNGLHSGGNGIGGAGYSATHSTPDQSPQ